MTALDAVTLVQLAENAGLTPQAAETAAAIAVAESGANPDAVGDHNNPSPGCASYGLWQINYCPSRDAGTIRAQVAADPTNPALNAKAMAAISGNGHSFTPWTTYRDGAYKKFITAAGVAVPGAGDTIVQPSTSQNILGTISSAVSDASDPLSALESLASTFAELANPQSWYRAALFVLGLGALVAGLIVVNRDTIEGAAKVAALA